MQEKWDEVYSTTLLWQNNRRQNGLVSRWLFSELCKITVNKVTFLGFKVGDRPNRARGSAPAQNGNSEKEQRNTIQFMEVMKHN